ncbi:hypothetical protein [uncultured Thiodictyon sp.]|uniref:hypothetical protein n=1 Tax=uncultured Thiodictyon sp. TaxID=1846217 RepID=UPI0025DABBBC|nr:hypothetical protein [uncultured Thiodictyon sp.]
MILLTRLYIYRASQQRSPAEDFLTEAFVEWLRLAGKAGLMAQALKDLLRLPPAQCLPPGDDGSTIRWSSQHVIGPGFRGSGKRPDIVGQADNFFLVIENKIGACFTQYDDDEGSVTQLELYADYQRLQQVNCGGVVLLTHHTDAPAGWAEPVVTWSAIHHWLSRLLPELASGASGSVAVLNYWTQHLIAFIEENGMSGTRIALSDIIALPAFERLRAGMRGLGILARKELTRRAGGQVFRGLSVPRGWTSGWFNEPLFFGVIMTPEGVKADDADFVLWCGVLASKAYEITPHTQGIPELSVGLGAWTKCLMNDNRAMGLKVELPEIFAATTPNMTWSIDWKPRESNAENGLFVVQARLSLIELYQQAGDDFWDDPAISFFSKACDALLSLPDDKWKMIESLVG